MGPVDRRRHQRLGLVAGKAEHHALVARALLLGLFPGHALGDVHRLLIHRRNNGAGPPVKTHIGTIVANLLDCVADNGGKVGIGLGGDLPGDEGEAGGDQGFASHVGIRVLGQDGIQDAVGNLVGDLVRMSLGHGFGTEEIPALGVDHTCPPFYSRAGRDCCHARGVFFLT